METNKYSRGKIYRIYSDVSNKIYIGSTIQPLSKRMGLHRSEKNETISRTMIQEDGIENCHIVLLEDYPCENKEQLLMRERYWIETIDCINKRKSILTQEEQVDYNRQWYEENREKLSEHKKQYYQENHDKILEYAKQYRQENHDDILEYKKQYYQKNRDEISEKGRQTHTCECGSTITIRNISRHSQSLKHQRFINGL